MKKASKVFVIIGMALGFFLIVPLAIGVNALDKINTAKKQEELKTIAILTLFFCSFLGGIFMLLIDDDDLKENGEPTEIDTDENKTVDNTDYLEKIKRLKRLYDEGILNQEEFEKKKSEYLSNL